MSLPADLSFMDLLMDKEDNLLKLDKDDEMKFFLDSKSINSDDWTNGVDFLDSLLEMESESLGLDDSQPLGDNINTSAPESVVESSSCSDSGVSCDQQLSPMVQDAEEDDLEEVIFEEEVYTEPEPVVKEEVIEVEDEELLDSDSTDESMDIKQEEPVVKLNVARAVVATQLPTVRVKPVPASASVPVPVPVPAGARRVIRVTPLQSANPRSIVIPVNSMTGVRTIKIINATKGQSTIVSGLRAGRLIGNPASVIRTVDGDSAPDRAEHNLYPRLRLTAEERRLMLKEGVTLPSHYPLTKHEERELKRIRRKIRNKISAQDSRKRKKEYVDGLEDRVKQCTDENQSLVKRLRALQSQNQLLCAQLRRLQAAVARGTAQTTQPATCLMVLVLSLALVLAPGLRSPRAATDADLDRPDAQRPPAPLAGRSRTLLFSKPSDQPPLEKDYLHQETINEEEIDKALSANLEGIMQFQNEKLDDHDYSQTVHIENKGSKRYIEPDIDDSWPPPKIPRADVSNRPEQALHNKTAAPPEGQKYMVELPD